MEIAFTHCHPNSLCKSVQRKLLLWKEVKKKITVTWSVVNNHKRLKIPRMVPVNFVVENTIHRLCFTLAAVITKSHAQFKLPEYAKPSETDIPSEVIILCARFYCKVVRPHKFKPHTLYFNYLNISDKVCGLASQRI